MTDLQHSIAFSVPSSHPALPGHFPGQPLVPGVMMLEQVAHGLRHWRGERLARIVEAKFLAPLLPDQRAAVTLTASNGRVRFEIRSDGVVLARGIVEGAAA